MIRRNQKANILVLTPTTYTALLVSLGYHPEDGDSISRYKGLEIIVRPDEDFSNNEQIRLIQ